MLTALITFAHEHGVRPQMSRAAHAGSSLLGDQASQGPDQDSQSSLSSAINQVSPRPGSIMPACVQAAPLPSAHIMRELGLQCCVARRMHVSTAEWGCACALPACMCQWTTQTRAERRWASSCCGTCRAPKQG